MEATLAARLADYRVLRRNIESNILPLAGSVDGRRFTLQAPVEGLRLRVGGYVALDSLGAPRLGQVLSLAIAHTDAGEIGWGGETTLSTRVQIRLVQGEGVVLDGPPEPFHDAVVRPAEPAEVQAWLRASTPSRAVLRAGELTLAPDLIHGLDAGGFDRHTFLCGQSGSGKTYALGVLLEQLLLATSLKIVVLDPNSDFVRLARAAPARSSASSRRATGPRRDGGSPSTARGRRAPDRLRVRLGELDAAHSGGRAAAGPDPRPRRVRGASRRRSRTSARRRCRSCAPARARAHAPRRQSRRRTAGACGPARDPGSTLDALEDPDRALPGRRPRSLGTREEQALPERCSRAGADLSRGPQRPRLRGRTRWRAALAADTAATRRRSSSAPRHCRRRILTG